MNSNVVKILALFALTALCCFAQAGNDPITRGAVTVEQILFNLSAIIGSAILIFAILSSGISGARVIASFGIALLTVYAITHSRVFVTWIQGI